MFTLTSKRRLWAAQEPSVPHQPRVGSGRVPKRFHVRRGFKGNRALDWALQSGIAFSCGICGNEGAPAPRPCLAPAAGPTPPSPARSLGDLRVIPLPDGWMVRKAAIKLAPLHPPYSLHMCLGDCGLHFWTESGLGLVESEIPLQTGFWGCSRWCLLPIPGHWFDFRHSSRSNSELCLGKSNLGSGCQQEASEPLEFMLVLRSPAAHRTEVHGLSRSSTSCPPHSRSFARSTPAIAVHAGGHSSEILGTGCGVNFAHVPECNRWRRSLANLPPDGGS